MNKGLRILINIFFLVSAFAAIAKADTAFVGKTADSNNPLPCSSCSLREAINTINQSLFTGQSDIFFSIPQNDPGCSGTGPSQICKITVGSEIAINAAGPLVIHGTGANLLTIHMGGTDRIFRGSSPLTIKGMILEFGQGRGSSPSLNGKGSAIYFSGFGGPLVLDGVVIQNNDSTALSGSTGAVYYSGGTGQNTITNSTFTGNTSGNCGAFDAESASVSVLNSTISGNAVFTFGGGICINGGTTKFRSSTIAGNTAVVAGNAAGGGIFLQNGTLNLGNTIVAGNTANSASDIDLFGAIALITVGGNLIGNNTSVAAQFPAGQANVNSDWVGDSATPLNPLLAPLGNYGGITPTRALNNVSPAINHGTFIFGETPTDDQRGGVRDSFIDIGAFEYNAAYVGVLPVAVLNQPYFQIISTNNGGFTYCISSGTLPPGLTGVPPCAPPLADKGMIAAPVAEAGIAASPDAVVAISGTPTTSGTYNFSMSATSGSNIAVTNYQLIVASPSAASVPVGGRVVTAEGYSISRAVVTLTDANGVSRFASTNSFGFFRFDNVEAGQTYTVSVQSRRYQFANQTQVISLKDAVTDLTFNALPFNRIGLRQQKLESERTSKEQK